MSQLIINNLKVSYENNSVLDKFNLELDDGELLVILGPSGCGKSTLLSSISGLIQPGDGKITLKDKVVFSKNDFVNVPVEKRNIGFIFQNYALWPHMSVFDNIAYPLKFKKKKKSIIKEKVYKLLENIGLKEKAHKYPHELSGGEKQRVGLARAIISQPDLLLLDEPLANIDAMLKYQILNLISQINKEYKIPMIYVTHDQNEAFYVADRIVIMREGRIIQDGCPRHIYKFPCDKFVAEFVGRNNLITSNFFDKLKCKKGCKNSMVAVRPEDINIDDDGEYKGKIKRIIYRGSNTELYVKFDGEMVIINVNTDKYKIGDTIKFNINRYHVIEK